MNAISRYKEHTPDLAAVFIDQMSFLVLSGETKKRDKINSRQEELKRICDDMRSFKNAHHISLVTAVQVSREGYKKGGTKGYELTGLSESGDIERVAHTVVVIEDHDKKKTNQRNVLEMTILKRRGEQTNIKAEKIYNVDTREVTNEDAPYIVLREDVPEDQKAGKGKSTKPIKKTDRID